MSQFSNKKTNIKSWSVTSTLNAVLRGLKTSKTHKTKLLLDRSSTVRSTAVSRELSWKLYLRIILIKKTIKKIPIRSCKIKIMLTDHKKVIQASRSHLWLYKANE